MGKVANFWIVTVQCRAAINRVADARYWPPRPPTRGRNKGGKGRETYKWNIKTALLITGIILKIKGIKQNRQNQYWVLWNWVPRGLVPGRHQEVPDWTLQLDGNWTRECTDGNLDQDRRQDKEQGPPQKLAITYAANFRKMQLLRRT